jgi:tripartite ATP-independent transporter DctM subunit
MLSFQAALSILVNDIYGLFMSYVLSVIPMFLFMGTIAFYAGMSKKLYACANEFVGFLPGGLAMATIAACASFSAICGSTNATAATMATVALPEMRKYNYDTKLATGVVAAAGSLGILIPPSGILIIYGILTEQSIGKLFAAGIIPGIILSILFMCAVYIWVRINPALGPKGQPSSLRKKLAALPGVLEMLALFSLVIGGLLFGFFTPTEAGAIGSAGSILIGVISRGLAWSGFINSIKDTFRMSCMIMIIVTGATIFGRFMALTRIPFEIAAWTQGLPFPPAVTMAVIILIYFFGGFFMDSFALILLTIPIFFPVVTTLGYDPIWFGVVIVLVTEMGVVTPPVGINVYVVSGIAKDVPLEKIFRGVLPLLCAMLILAGIILIFPEIVLFLPNLMK